MMSLFASLELLPIAMKIEMGDLIVRVLPQLRREHGRLPLVWALGRLGQRVPVYGPLNTVVPRENASAWLKTLLVDSGGDGAERLAVMQMARRTDDRYRDVDPALRGQTANWLERHRGSHHLLQLVQEGGRLDAEEQRQVFGESLPKGLRIA
jgi:hypothetical protein